LAAPPERQRVRVPADVELEDRLAFGLSARQLALLAATALLAYSTYALTTTILPSLAALVLAAPVAVAGATLALVRLEALPADRLAVAAARYLRHPRHRILAAEPLPPRIAEHAAVAPFVLPVRAIATDGVVAHGERSHSLLVRASGTNFQLRSNDEQAALVEAFGRLLNALSDPIAIVVRAEPVDLQPLVTDLEHRATTLPAQLAATAQAHARFLGSLAADDSVRRREILLTFTTRARDEQQARQSLQRRLAETRQILRAAAVELHDLDGDQTTALLSRTADPPGAPIGSSFTGLVRAC
jgi:hypothetical protein